MKAPFSWPKSSDSIRDSVSPEQSTGTKGPRALRLAMWMARAASSLPVPDSPRRSTATSEGATRPTSSSMRLNAGDRPTSPSGFGRAEAP